MVLFSLLMDDHHLVLALGRGPRNTSARCKADSISQPMNALLRGALSVFTSIKALGSDDTTQH